ncbi:hypothetical protein, conserved [Plasmodium gonderi]|uniref:Amine oxidase domain-containing protein n=1 Tax=Plasmodium gonderi TaxID=77519 RepID=A0A1Y1JDA5_PLAGO|nr:hypothetical protein, conserved [Plasmodium gonderi]GAW79305.1 hypothetical protein, conserved [Plasmodium gonderi]
MAKATKNICIVGGGIDSMCLSFYLSKNKHRIINLLKIKKKCNLINTSYSYGNICENGSYYSFAWSDTSPLFQELLRSIDAQDEVIQSNKYTNNISYMDECGSMYRINKFLVRIIFNLLKDHFWGSSVPISKDERLDSFLSKRLDSKICEDVIHPYCYHYFGYPPKDVLMSSHFPNFMEKMKKGNSLISALRSVNQKNNPVFTKNKKIVKFRKGNVTLLKKLEDHLELCNNISVISKTGNLRIRCMRRGVKVTLGRKIIKCNEIIFCLNPMELRKFLKNVKFEGNKKDMFVRKYLCNFHSHTLRISNVCFSKNVLPFSHSLESLLLFKRNKQNNLISLLYDRNIFTRCDLLNAFGEKGSEKSTPEEDFYETSLRFMSKERDEQKSVEEIKWFLRSVLGVQENPDLLISNVHNIFPINKYHEKKYKKIINRKCTRVKIFWTFYFFRNLEFCLREAKEFSEAV